MKNFFVIRLTFTNVVSIICLLILLVLALIPTNYLMMSPGKLIDLGDKIMVNGELRDDGKAFKIVTVSVYEARLLHYLCAKAINSEDIILDLDSLVFGKEEEKVIQKEMMEESKKKSAEIAYSGVREEFNLIGDGVFVVDVLEDSGAYGNIFAGDIIIELDNKIILNTLDLTRAIRQKNIGDFVGVVVLRGNEKLCVDVRLSEHIEYADVPAIGVVIENYEKERKMNDDIVILIDDVLGSSGELMFTLEIYDRLSDQDLIKGHNITGSGILTNYGKVLPIDGIKYKVIAANKEGMDYFICAKENYEEGINYVSGGMKLIPVETLDDALNFLSSLE